jgi:cysteine synthase A
MIEEAEKRVRKGMRVVEPTSGNSGIGLAIVCAIKGYELILVMPGLWSKVRAHTLRKRHYRFH